MQQPLGYEPAGFLAKAEENLADARAALAARRYNACANRSYYAAFQVAVAALWVAGIRPTDPWTGTLSHKMVLAEWSGRLVSRRKLYPPETPRALYRLSDIRNRADYTPVSITARQAVRAVADSELVVEQVRSRLQPPGGD